MTRLACWLFGHRWEPMERYVSSAGILLKIRICHRCGHYHSEFSHTEAEG